ncbi:polysaccharide pyruvyl transferase family protein [Mariniluteicoccus flavus]
MKSTVVSFFDSANLGDLLIGQSLLGFAKQFGDAVPLSFSGDPFRIVDPESYRSVEVERFSTARIGWKSRFAATGPGSFVAGVMRSRRPDHRRLEAMIEGSDVMLLGGGNMIFDLEAWTRSWDRFRYFQQMASRLRVPTFAISLGIGPFATVAQHRGACRVLDRCDAITFRDTASLELYSQYGRHSAQVSVDPVLLMSQSAPRPCSSKRTIAWNLVEPRLLGETGAAGRQELKEECLAAVGGWLRQGYVVNLFSTDGADAQFLNEIQSELSDPGCQLVPVTGLQSLLDLYSQSDAVVAGRMHSLIVAFTQGLPIVGLSWQRKVSAFFSLLDRQDQMVDYMTGSLASLDSKLEAALAAPDRFSITSSDRARLQSLHDVDRAVMEGFAVPR